MRHPAPLRTVLSAFLMAITPAGTALANAGNVLAQYNLGTAEAL